MQGKSVSRSKVFPTRTSRGRCRTFFSVWLACPSTRSNGRPAFLVSASPSLGRVSQDALFIPQISISISIYEYKIANQVLQTQSSTLVPPVQSVDCGSDLLASIAHGYADFGVGYYTKIDRFGSNTRCFECCFELLHS
jgi:hypothetical protein